VDNTDKIKMSFATVCGSSSDSSRLEVQLHWRLSCWSWSKSDWRQVYESQSAAVLLGEQSAAVWFRFT